MNIRIQITGGKPGPKREKIKQREKSMCKKPVRGRELQDMSLKEVSSDWNKRAQFKSYRSR